MIPLAISLPVEDGLSAPEIVDIVVAGERAGYEVALCGEVAGPEPFVVLALAAARTSHIRLATGIAGVYVRPATLAAMGYASLSSIAPGRVVAGVGASSPIIVGDWHGLAFERPLATVEAYVSALRSSLAGERQPGGFRLSMDPGGPVPIWVAAMGPQMLRMAGRRADGVHLAWTPPDELGPKLELVAEGAAESGRTLDDLELSCSFWAYAGDRTNEAIERMRRAVLNYAIAPTHRASFESVWPRLDEALAAWARNDRSAALACVGEEVVHRMGAVGADEIAARALAYRRAGIDLPALLIIGVGPGDALGPRQTVERTAAVMGDG